MFLSYFVISRPVCGRWINSPPFNCNHMLPQLWLFERPLEDGDEEAALARVEVPVEWGRSYQAPRVSSIAQGPCIE